MYQLTRHDCKLGCCCKSLPVFCEFEIDYCFMSPSLICPCKIELPSARLILACKDSVRSRDNGLVSKVAS